MNMRTKWREICHVAIFPFLGLEKRYNYRCGYTRLFPKAP